MTVRILELLNQKISMTIISKICHLSLTTVIRVLKSVEKHLPETLKPRSFLKVLMVDEFRSHATYEDKMSFICVDGETGELVDVLPRHRLDKLMNYFNHPSKEKR